MNRKIILPSTLFATLILLLLMNFTTPNEIGPLGVLVFFTMFYVVMFGVMDVIVLVIRRMLLKKREKLAKRQDGKIMRERREYFLAAVLAFIPVLILVFRSAGMNVFEMIAIILAVEVFGGILVWKRT